VISTLQGVSGLPAPLGSLVTQITGALGGAGSIFGGVPGLSPTQVTNALAALGSLPGLSAGASVPGGALAPVGAILAQPGVPAPVASTVTTVAGTLEGSGAISPASLQSLISTLQGAGGLLPAPLGGVVTDIAATLGTAGSLVGGTTGTGTGTGTGHATITRAKRSRNLVAITLHCTASANRTCRTAVTVNQGGRQLARKTITIRGGRTVKVTLRYRRAPRGPLRITASSR
jgi:hypothetical protein